MTELIICIIMIMHKNLLHAHAFLKTEMIQYEEEKLETYHLRSGQKECDVLSVFSKETDGLLPTAYIQSIDLEATILTQSTTNYIHHCRLLWAWRYST